MRSPERRRGPHRGSQAPRLESLERRELLASAASIAALETLELAAARSSAIVASPDSPNGLLGKNPPGPFLNPAVLKQFASYLYPASSPPGAPTAREIHRETFTARWIGLYTIGSPRFSDRADTIHLYGTAGGSNQFFRGKFDMSLFPPSDPAATPTPGNPYANQITGIASLFAQNYLQSSSMVVLDLNGTPPAGSSPTALPTQLTWTYDSNTSAGAYAAPGGVVPGAGYAQGAGTLQIHWIPDAHPLPGTRGSGQVVLTFQGLINGSQIVSPVSKFIS